MRDEMMAGDGDGDVWDQQQGHVIGPMEREAPHSIEAEQSVIGAVLLNNAAHGEVSWLRVEDFHHPAHRTLWRTIGSLLAEHTEADPVTVKQALGASGELESVGGPGYAAELMDTVPSAANVVAYARLVRELADKRRVIGLLGEVLEQAYAPKVKPSDLVEQADAGLFALGSEMTAGRSRQASMAELMTELGQDAAYAVDYHGGRVSISTTYQDLDGMLGGLMPDDLIYIGGRPGMGKTALALNMAFRLAASGTPVGFFSLEMSGMQLAARMAAIQSGGRVSPSPRHGVTKDDVRAIYDVAAAIDRLPLVVDDTPGMTLGQIRAGVRRMVRQSGVRVVIVDYLGLIASEGREENQNVRIGAISAGLKRIARETRTAVICLVQLSRSVESRTDKRPTLSDMRDSGNLEQDADAVAFCYRPWYYTKSPADEGVFKLIVAKNRHGEGGEVPLTYIAREQRVEDAA
jgi:replicative DNA helicase